MTYAILGIAAVLIAGYVSRKVSARAELEAVWERYYRGND